MRRFVVLVLVLGCAGGTFDWPPVLTLVPGELSFDSAGELTATAVLGNWGTHEADWTASSPAWLTCLPSSGTLTGQSKVTLTLTADPTGLAAGMYDSTFEITAPGAFGDARARATLNIASVLEVVPDEFSFDSSGELTATAVLRNLGTEPADWTVTCPAWLSCSPSSGTLAGPSEVSLSLAADPTGLPDGIYGGTLQVDSSVAVGDPRAPVTLTKGMAPGSSQLVYYTSFVDGSLQPYGLYVPDPYDAGVPHPVAFHGHGYSGSASTSFSAYATSFADSNGWLLVETDGRGSCFYDGVGQTDLFEVIGDLSSRFYVDRSRLYFEGYSMGATGAYRLAARHVGLFAAAAGCDGWTDYRLFSAHYYGPAGDRWEVHPARVVACEAASALYSAENLRHTPLYTSTDLGDGSVWPENGVKLAQKLSGLGITHTPDIGPGGHTARYELDKYYPFFASAAPKEDAPTEVSVRTNQLKYGGAFWAQVLRFTHWGAFGELQATASDGRVDVTVENVERYSVDFSAAPVGSSGAVDVYTNAILSYSGATPAGELALYATFDGEGALVGTGVYAGPASLEKTPELEGPINHALCSPWVAAYGTDAGDKTEAEYFVGRWNAWYGGSAEAVPEAAVGVAEMEEKNVVLFGTADSSLLVAQVQSALDFTLDLRADGLTFGSNVYAGAEYGLFMVYPNPLAPERYVVLSHLMIDGDFSVPEAWPWYWPDYIVFDTTLSMRDCYNGSWAYVADAWVESGYFDKDWQLNNDAADPRTDVSVSLDKASYTGSDTTAVVTASVTDENASGVLALPSGALVLYLDGETKAAAFSEGGGGDYSASLDIAGLDAAGYAVKVLVRRAGSWGMGLVRMTVE